jgi:hypothetical protein
MQVLKYALPVKRELEDAAIDASRRPFHSAATFNP